MLDTVIEKCFAVGVCLYVIEKLISLIKWLWTKKAEGTNTKESSNTFEICQAEIKEVTALKLNNLSKQHEKMIETLGAMTTNIALMNDTCHSTNGKAGRIEKQVNSIADKL